MTRSVLFEIGLEEMPARFIDDALEQLRTKTAAWFETAGVPYEAINVFATPRRLAIHVTGVEEKQPDREEEAKGPAKTIALDEEGNWSKAAIGFSKGQGVSVEDIYFKEVKGTAYAFVTKFIEGAATIDLLHQFKDIVLALTFPKNMRWGSQDLRYVRPIRWLVGLFGSEVIPFDIVGVSSDRISYGHRFLGSRIAFETADDYVEQLKQDYVIVDPDERERMIMNQIHDLESEKQWEILVDQNLLREVNHLVEYPTLFNGDFNEEFLVVPEEALIKSMKEHQRYFPVRSKEGTLLPHFVGVRNGDDNFLGQVVKGNEKVLRARLADAQFFFEEDQKGSIDQKMAKLSRIVFQEELGTLQDKTDRVNDIAGRIADRLGMTEEEKQHVSRASAICKFDLVTHMVDEFPDLQGVMGEKYARLFGEEEQVAKAISEHYLPRHAQGALPSTEAGAVLSVADKLDTIIGSIATGIVPSGSQDPYGLRRQALGVLQIMNVWKWNITVEALIQNALNRHEELNLPTRPRTEVEEDLASFFRMRASYLLRAEQVESDIIDAVLVEGIGHYPFTLQKAGLLAAKRNDDQFRSVHEALGRVLNLAEKASEPAVDPELFENQSEEKLYQVHQEIQAPFTEAINNQQADAALAQLEALADPIHAYFDHTMVMVGDESKQRNRLGLLKKIAQDIYTFADFNAVQWKQHV
ncbi:glycine--tRNA ligase subunit beta [Thalassobacillus sp. CUG 92003]|uniref:glycine--tRNA ligase subunit beta n=1 Tax=Thalassobacillus sp. CUG 92003 TaxID=2736641 RepID=UPI0015E7484E|nr:glycine--tRNA ligase subunit beta [Thalassobacillus sp. CUG 92003]